MRTDEPRSPAPSPCNSHELASKKRDRLSQPLFERNLWLPLQELAGAGDVRPSLPWIAARQLAVAESPFSARRLSHRFGELENGHLFWIAEVHRVRHVRGGKPK